MVRMVIFDDREHQSAVKSRGSGGGAAAAAGSMVRADFGPLTDLRASFELRTGMLVTRDRLAKQWQGGLAGVWVPGALARLVAERSDVPVNRLPAGEISFLCVNGRWSFPVARFDLKPGEALVEADSGDVVATHLARAAAEVFLRAGRLPGETDVTEYHGQMLLRRPWEILAALPKTLLGDLLSYQAVDEMEELPAGVVKIGDEPVVVERSAKVFATAVLDATGGPIVIEAGAMVRPRATIIGPASVGAGSTVLDGAIIKANTVIGPQCKVGGEVGATMFQGFSNKAHDGHLGDSLVGEWVNLGAGTVNSNLLNTYGEVVMRLAPSGPRERTGMMFLGTIFGDHVKTAIATRIMTGTVIGTGAMIASTAAPAATVGAFAWVTDRGVARFRFEKFEETARRMMARRHVEPSEVMVGRWREVFAMSEAGSGGSSSTSAPAGDA